MLTKAVPTEQADMEEGGKGWIVVGVILDANEVEFRTATNEMY